MKNKLLFKTSRSEIALMAGAILFASVQGFLIFAALTSVVAQ